MDANELKKLRNEASATIARIDKAIADLAEKPTTERPFRRGEPVLVWEDERYKFIGFFVELLNGYWRVSASSALVFSLPWLHCEHLPTFIAWDLIDSSICYAAEYDSGLVSARISVPEIGAKTDHGIVVAVHKRPEEDK